MWYNTSILFIFFFILYNKRLLVPHPNYIGCFARPTRSWSVVSCSYACRRLICRRTGRRISCSRTGSTRYGRAGAITKTRRHMVSNVYYWCLISYFHLLCFCFYYVNFLSVIFDNICYLIWLITPCWYINVQRDIGGLFGLLKGGLVYSYLKKHLPVHTLEECRIPIGTTAFDMFRFKTTVLNSGCLPTAMLASCTFPGLFQPVIINSTPHIDG